MKCFNHPDVEAVGICKSCNKGICKECLTEVENGIACKGKCEDEVKELNSLLKRNKVMFEKSNAMIEKSKTIYNISSATCYRNAVFLILMAIVFAVASIPLDMVRILTIPASVVMGIGAIFMYITGKKMANKE
jgi:hypothetical protein